MEVRKPRRVPEILLAKAAAEAKLKVSTGKNALALMAMERYLTPGPG
jgi:hypothetical protein